MSILRTTLSLTLLAFCPLAAEDLPLAEIRTAAAAKSQYLSDHHSSPAPEILEADLKGFQKTIKPILEQSCVQCHGPDKEKGNFRIDKLNPDLVNGPDADWWLEALQVITNGEMPPPEDDVELTDANRVKTIDWLSGQIQIASQVQRGSSKHSSFRRMTNYEFVYALQDLLGLSTSSTTNLIELLPQEATSDEGFRNSSQLLQLTSRQFASYRQAARKALKRSAVWDPRPAPVYYAITMDKAGEPYQQWAQFHYDDLSVRKEANNDIDVGGRARFKQILESLQTGESYRRNNQPFFNRENNEHWSRHTPYGFSLWKPTPQKPTDPARLPLAMVLKHGSSQQVDLGHHLPDQGSLTIRVRAERTSTSASYPSLRLSFGARTSNSGQEQSVVSQSDLAVTAAPGKPEFYQWQVSLRDLNRNPYLRTGIPGERPNPSEYITLHNVHQNPDQADGATVHIDYIEVIAAGDQQWPPASYNHVFPREAASIKNEEEKARFILTKFMPQAWRRPVTENEIQRRLTHFKNIRPTIGNFEESLLEVFVTILSSPHFLYLSQAGDSLTNHELASRLSFFLWSSGPDAELFKVASSGQLHDPTILAQQTERMLAHPRARRLAQNFTHQWLALEGLDFLQVDRQAHPDFSSELKTAMQEEPLAFFQALLAEDLSVIDFLHADFALLNQRLALHYGIEGVAGNYFRKVLLPSTQPRGGLLTQAGLLAMNSDGKDSNPLKRGVWLLENILHDPPPPPPPAVPEIDLTDPRILEMTLKERMEDHRNKPACFSCHAKIDPWGIALEQFDALGVWRDQINGDPVDANSILYNDSKLNGIDGLKRYLLANRQDQFTAAIVHKLSSYALGRPLGFADHAELENITAQLRQKGDGLRTLVHLLVASDLFKSNSIE